MIFKYLEMCGSALLAIPAPLLVRVPMKDRKLFPTIGFRHKVWRPENKPLLNKPDSSE